MLPAKQAHVRSARKPAVLLPVLIQDPSVAADTSLVMSLIHPVVVKDPVGFNEGPVCRRVAIVDLDFHTGRFGPPARFDPKGSAFRNVATYQVSIPARKGARIAPWSRRSQTVALERLGSSRYYDPFLKVSVFGIVLRTLGLVQDRVALGRKVKWAFPGEQLLVVPRAGVLENAFYHRESRSLQFYYGALETRRRRTVYAALSQDIVAHETAHAIIDGIAPDLYNASSPESLAIHEALADMTAALLSMRNRELLPQELRASPETLQAIQHSSRFSRIAEEFGRWRGHGDALRDVYNEKTLDPEGAEDCRVDAASPHSLSEVLSGALFAVFRNEFAVMPSDPRLVQARHRDHRLRSDPTRWQTTYAVNRLLSLIYKGLDWLPPGEASFGDLIRAMIVADEVYLPKESTARGLLLHEARRRHMLPEGLPRDAALGIAAAPQPQLHASLRASAEARLAFVETYRASLGIAAGTRVRVSCRRSDVYEPALVPDRQQGESFTLVPQWTRRELAGRSKYLLVKLHWSCVEPSDLGPQWGELRRYKAGATLVFDSAGRLQAVLKAGANGGQGPQRGEFLKRLLLADAASSGGRRFGPDGLPLQAGLRARVHGNILAVAGAFRALHVAGETP